MEINSASDGQPDLRDLSNVPLDQLQLGSVFQEIAVKCGQLIRDTLEKGGIVDPGTLVTIIALGVPPQDGEEQGIIGADVSGHIAEIPKLADFVLQDTLRDLQDFMLTGKLPGERQ